MDALITSVLILMVVVADYMGRAVRCSCNKVIAGIFVAAICLSGVCSQEGNNRHVMGERVPYAALRAENEALRRENQMLRRELISKNGALPDSLMPEKGVARDEGLEPVDKETGYWISAKTKVRHNKRCRNYRRVKGHPCGPNDGRPCKSCGG